MSTLALLQIQEKKTSLGVLDQYVTQKERASEVPEGALQDEEAIKLLAGTQKEETHNERASKVSKGSLQDEEVVKLLGVTQNEVTHDERAFEVFEGDLQDEEAVQLHGDSQKEVNYNEDFCSKDGRVCLYHNICFDSESGSWQTEANVANFPLLNSRNWTEHIDEVAFDGCNEKFEPLPNMPFPSESEMIYKKGTSYLTCCWVNHFGHILMNMAASAVHSLRHIGMTDRFRKNEISFIVDNRASSWGSPSTILNFLEFLTADSSRVSSLQALEKESKQDGKDKVCFEKLVVGMLYDDLVSGNGRNEPGSDLNMLQPMRRHLDKMYPLTKESTLSAIEESKLYSSDNFTDSPPECTITILQRTDEQRNLNKHRNLGNFSKVMRVAKEVFHEPKWNIRSVTFDAAVSYKSQYLTVRSSMVLISVSGTGSHMAMFLPEGGVSYEILYAPINLNNNHICRLTPSLSCIGSQGFCPESTNCKKEKYVYVRLKDFRKKTAWVKEKISSKCMNSKSLAEMNEGAL